MNAIPRFIVFTIFNSIYGVQLITPSLKQGAQENNFIVKFRALSSTAQL